ncbi:hypothetical protein AB0L05_09390 [Nonomuraea pusilla]|uniref:hypothetical protein n=1 Tax=Nonomuraea pusilla TaxID=46177 RepID=UPI0033349064
MSGDVTPWAEPVDAAAGNDPASDGSSSDEDIWDAPANSRGISGDDTAKLPAGNADAWDGDAWDAPGRSGDVSKGPTGTDD